MATALIVARFKGEAAKLRLEAGIRTLRDVLADEIGSDWQEAVEQRAIEIAFFKECGMVLAD